MNKKGISPVVAVVLLIAIAVIAAVGLYFWIGSLTGQPTTKQKPRTIAASTVNCDANGNSKILISNTADPSTEAINANSTGDGDLQTSMSEVELDCGTDAEIETGDTTSCTAKNFYKGNGTLSIFGNNVAATEVSC